MSESLSDDELAKLVRSGRINTSKASAKKRNVKTSNTSKNETKQQVSLPRVRDPPREVAPASSDEELDPEWLRTEKERAERNIAAEHQDKRRSEEMREASKF